MRAINSAIGAEPVLVAQCKALVRQYVPQIVSLVRTMSDRRVCAALGLCDSDGAALLAILAPLRSRKLAMTQRYGAISELQPALKSDVHGGVDAGVSDSTQCQLCHIFVDYVKMALASNATDAEIEKARRGCERV